MGDRATMTTSVFGLALSSGFYYIFFSNFFVDHAEGIEKTIWLTQSPIAQLIVTVLSKKKDS